MNHKEAQKVDEDGLIASVGELLRRQNATQAVLDTIHGRDKPDASTDIEQVGSGSLGELRRRIEAATRGAVAIESDVDSILNSIGPPP